MKPVLIDTSCIVALLDRSERHHKTCAKIVTGLQEPLATCEAVIAESSYLLRDVPGAPEAILENVERGIIRILFRLEESSAPVRRLMTKYRQVPMDLADACLVCMAENLETGRILTLDTDFTIYRWHGHKSFENLLMI